MSFSAVANRRKPCDRDFHWQIKRYEALSRFSVLQATKSRAGPGNEASVVQILQLSHLIDTVNLCNSSSECEILMEILVDTCVIATCIFGKHLKYL